MRKERRTKITTTNMTKKELENLSELLSEFRELCASRSEFGTARVVENIEEKVADEWAKKKN